jgi:hypothetical protein
VIFSITLHHRNKNLLRYAPEKKSCPRVDKGKQLLKNLKLTIRLKNQNWTNPKIKNYKKVMNSDLPDHR